MKVFLTCKLLFLLFLLSYVEYANSCEIGIISIKDGIWVNRDTILSNCENCYKGDTAQINDCKRIYLQSADDNILEYNKEKEVNKDLLPKFIGQSKMIPYSHEILSYFIFKYPGSPKSFDTLETIYKLSNDDIMKLDGWTSQRYVDFLRNINGRLSEYAQFKELLSAKVPDFDSKKVKLSILDIVKYKPVYRIKDQNEYLFYFLYYADFAKECPDYKVFVMKAESSEILKFMLFIRENISQKISGNVEPVSTKVINNTMAVMHKLSSNSLNILFENDYIYDCTISDIISHIENLYQKQVLNNVNIEKSKTDFLQNISIDNGLFLLSLMEKYRRNEARQLKLGYQVPNGYLEMKRIFRK
jgi:hypothetical protein